MLDEFVSRKHARSKVRFDHPSLEPLLADTYGIIVYQEQVTVSYTHLDVYKRQRLR